MDSLHEQFLHQHILIFVSSLLLQRIKSIHILVRYVKNILITKWGNYKF